MVTIKDIVDYLDSTYVSRNPAKYYKSIADIANMPKIATTEKAYDFDMIKKDINQNSRSCDALFIGKKLNFIEFKQGFDKPFTSENYKLKIENMKLSIQLKACHTLQIFNNEILPQIGDGVLPKYVSKVFCVVIDTTNQEIYDEVYLDIQLEEAEIISNYSLKKSMLDGILKNLRSETKSKRRAFYDDAFVLYNYEFDNKFGKIIK